MLHEIMFSELAKIQQEKTFNLNDYYRTAEDLDELIDEENEQELQKEMRLDIESQLKGCWL